MEDSDDHFEVHLPGLLSEADAARVASPGECG